jgi:Ca-activated chloride channel family protein
MNPNKSTYNFLTQLRFISITLKIFLLATALLLLFFLILSQKDIQANNKAVKYFNKGDFKTASNMLNSEIQKHPLNHAILNNAAGAEYKLNNLNEAGEKYNATIVCSSITSKNEKFTALYNLGNVEYKKGDFQRAFDLYKEALKLNPIDKDAKYNLEMALLRLNEQNEQTNNKSNKNKNNKNAQDNTKNNKEQDKKETQNHNQPNRNKDNNPTQQNKSTNDNIKNSDAKNKQEQNGNPKDKNPQNILAQDKYAAQNESLKRENKKTSYETVILNYYNETDKNYNKRRTKLKMPMLNQPQKDW